MLFYLDWMIDFGGESSDSFFRSYKGKIVSKEFFDLLFENIDAQST